MCVDAFNDFKLLGYVDEIIFGISKSFEGKYKEKYDKLAEDISCGKNKMCYKQIKFQNGDMTYAL